MSDLHLVTDSEEDSEYEGEDKNYGALLDRKLLDFVREDSRLSSVLSASTRDRLNTFLREVIIASGNDGDHMMEVLQSRTLRSVLNETS